MVKNNKDKNHDEIKKLKERILELEAIDARRARAEEDLRAERDMAHRYLDVAGVILLALDKDAKVSLINRKGCEILGYTEPEILGKD
jgi:PAS domain-containing protein